MSYTQSVVTEIRRKTSGAFETPVKLGVEQGFVGSLLNSHNNNLEEQTMLGLDCLTTIWVDNDVKYMTKKFFNGDLATVSNNGYYILFVADYSNATLDVDYFFKDNGVFFPEFGISGAYFDNMPDDLYRLLVDKADTYTFSNSQFKINPQYKIMRKEVLCLRTDISNMSDTQINSDILISEKIIEQKADDNGKIFIKNNIVNHLGA